jgi:hypothetical protein
VGFGIISQFFYNQSNSETKSDAYERLLFIGGFGGWPSTSDLYDGMACRTDVWSSGNGIDWILLTDDVYFGPRAWFGLAIWTKENNPSEDVAISAKGDIPRIWVKINILTIFISYNKRKLIVFDL